MQVLNWHEVSNTTQTIFNIWVDKPELRWAEEAWIKLSSQGLTSYQNDIERTVVLIRLFTLGTIYHEFCEVAFEESADLSYSLWISSLADDDFYISPLRLGQIVNPVFLTEELILDEDIEKDLTRQVVATLIEEERPVVVESLIREFGSVSSLFVSLWRSNQNDEISDPEEMDIHIETDYEILNTPTEDKMAAFEWVSEGMPPIHNDVSYSIRRTTDTIEQLIADGESDYIEFKIAACLNPHSNQKDNEMALNVIRTIAAFMNSKGGTLLIGVRNDGEVVGVEREYDTADPRKRNRDGYQLFLIQKIRSKINEANSHLFYTISFHSAKEVDVCKISVILSRELVFVDGDLYVRNGNQTIKLNAREAINYRQMRQSAI